MRKTATSTCCVKRANLPVLNTIEEFNPDQGQVKTIPAAKLNLRATEPRRMLPYITQDEWKEIVNSMTEVEWAFFISILESEEQARETFDLRAYEWPGIAGTEKTQQQASGTQVLEEESDMTEGFLEIEQEDSCGYRRRRRWSKLVLAFWPR